MDQGRKVQRYFAESRMNVRPLGGSWQGDPMSPHAATNKPLLVIDELHDDPQQLRPEEAEALHGIPRGSTDGLGITSLMRLRCIGAGWDINITRMILRHFNSPSLMAIVEAHALRLEEKCTEEEFQMGELLVGLSLHHPQQHYN